MLAFHPTYRAGVPRVVPEGESCNALEGTTHWCPKKSLWNFTHAIGFALGAAYTTTDCVAFLEGFSVFFATVGSKYPFTLFDRYSAVGGMISNEHKDIQL